MKAIELSQEQKDKLIEMCNKLFPKDDFWWEYEMYGRGLKQDFDGVLCVHHKFAEPLKYIVENKEYFRTGTHFNIHWFEFCVTYLFDKIMVIPNGYESIEDYIQLTSSFIFGHPVDFLYEEFKKIK